MIQNAAKTTNKKETTQVVDDSFSKFTIDAEFIEEVEETKQAPSIMVDTS